MICCSLTGSVDFVVLAVFLREGSSAVFGLYLKFCNFSVFLFYHPCVT